MKSFRHSTSSTVFSLHCNSVREKKNLIHCDHSHGNPRTFTCFHWDRYRSTVFSPPRAVVARSRACTEILRVGGQSAEWGSASLCLSLYTRRERGLPKRVVPFFYVSHAAASPPSIRFFSGTTLESRHIVAAVGGSSGERGEAAEKKIPSQRDEDGARACDSDRNTDSPPPLHASVAVFLLSFYSSISLARSRYNSWCFTPGR